MEQQTVDDIARLRAWLLTLTGKDFWVRRINGQFVAVFEGARLAAETYEEARDKWKHAVDRWGWLKTDSCEKWEGK